MTTNEVFWYVAHTRPRCEKKLADYCQREGFLVTLPCYRAVHKYRGKTVAFQKPLFPGYVFLQLLTHQRQKVYQSDYVANMLDVPDQETFAQQLADILRALETVRCADWKARLNSARERRSCSFAWISSPRPPP